jgi:hypothetical protein
MAVQVPRLQYAGQTPEVSAGRIDTQTPDAAKYMEHDSKVIAGATKEGLDYWDRIEAQQADVTSNEAMSQYETKVKVAHALAQKHQGDPTPVYSKLREDMALWKSEVMKNYENSSSRTQRAIEDKIARSDFHLRDNIAVSEALQSRQYDTHTTQATVKLYQDNLLDAAQTLDVNDPESFGKFKSIINDIHDVNQKYGDRQGLMYKRENGELAMTDTLKYQIKSDISKGLKDVIMTLQNSGRHDQADALMEYYKDDLIADTKTQLLNHKSKSKNDQEVNQTVAEISALPPEKADARIQSLIASGSPIAKRVDEQYTAMQRHAQTRKDLVGKDAFNQSLKVIQAGIANGTIISSEDVRQNKLVQNLSDRMNGKQLQLLYDLPGQRPKHSDAKTFSTVADMAISNKFEGMDAEAFESLSRKLDPSDYKHFRSAWESANTQSPSQEHTMYNYMGKMLEEKLKANKVIKPRRTDWTAKDYDKFQQAYGDMLEATKTFPVEKRSTVDQEKWVDEYVKRVNKQGVFESGDFNGTGKKLQSAPSPTPPPKGPDFVIREEDLGKWVTAYKKANNVSKIPTMVELKNWAAKNSKALQQGD